MEKSFEVLISDIIFPNIGIGMAGDVRIAVKNALPGQLLRISAKRRGKRAKGRVLEIIKPADYEIQPDCDVFGICGGCAFLNLGYAKELEIKAGMVRRLLAGLVPDDAWLPAIAAPADTRYRNKMEFSFGDDGAPGGELRLGMRRRGSFYEVCNGDDCLLCHADFGQIVAHTRRYFANAGLAFHHRNKQTGVLRHLVVRRTHFTGEILVNLVTTPGGDYTDYAHSLTTLDGLAGQIAGIIHTQNDSIADVVLPQNTKLLFGRDYILENLLDLQFKISPFSFFQTNSAGAEILYETVRDFAGDISGQTIYDLYCGCGTIAQIMAKNAKNVIGIELIGEAVQAARENALANNLTNCQFIEGDVRRAITDLPPPDMLILDPPREGIHPKALAHIASFAAPRIIYISCKATSLATDLAILKEANYTIKKIRLHDLFPKTANVEVVVLLESS